MLSLKTVDGTALLAMLATCFTIPLAACASIDAPGAKHPDSGAFQSIRPGMRAAEVFERLGAPIRKERFDRLGATAWDYQFHDGWGYDAEFSVMVDDQDMVISKIATRLGN